MKFEVVLRAVCVVAGLWLARLEAAEPVSPLIGATRQQVLSRYGEPRSQMAAGDRLVFLYPGERVVFRGDVVIDVEAVIPEPVRRPPSPETPPAATIPGAETTAPAAATPEPGPASPPPETPAASVPPPPPPEPKVGIKLIRPPGSKDLPPVAPPISSPAPSRATTAPATEGAAPEEATAKVEAETAGSMVLSTVLAEANEARRAAEQAAAAEKEQRSRARKEALRRLDDAARTEETSGGMFSGRTWLIIGAVLVAGVAFIFWHSRRRPIELAGAAVNPAPAGGPSSAMAGTSFTADMVEELEWSRFERLVISYYSKTGVVAAPTNAGPDGAVQIKISWKGEPRPFAYVRCVANSAGVVDVKPLNELRAALAADDIRRGYVVTAGRFTPAARGLAAEKQLTLLSGDVLLEKINALPLAARTELMRDIGAS